MEKKDSLNGRRRMFDLEGRDVLYWTGVWPKRGFHDELETHACFAEGNGERFGYRFTAEDVMHALLSRPRAVKILI